MLSPVSSRRHLPDVVERDEKWRLWGQEVADRFGEQGEESFRDVTGITAMVEDECSGRAVGTRLRPAFPEGDAGCWNLARSVILKNHVGTIDQFRWKVNDYFT